MLSLRENISSSSFVNIFHESEYIDKRTTRARIEGFSPFTLALSACAGVPRSECNELWEFKYMGLGLARFAFARSNAVLAFYQNSKFSVKNIYSKMLLLYSLGVSPVILLKTLLK